MSKIICLNITADLHEVHNISGTLTSNFRLFTDYNNLIDQEEVLNSVKTLLKRADKWQMLTFDLLVRDEQSRQEKFIRAVRFLKDRSDQTIKHAETNSGSFPEFNFCTEKSIINAAKDLVYSANNTFINELKKLAPVN